MEYVIPSDKIVVFNWHLDMTALILGVANHRTLVSNLGVNYANWVMVPLDLGCFFLLVF